MSTTTAAGLTGAGIALTLVIATVLMAGPADVRADVADIVAGDGAGDLVERSEASRKSRLRTSDPLRSFIETNRGQAPDTIDFVARASGYVGGIAASGLTVLSATERVVVRLSGADEAASGVPVEPLPGVSHYVRGAATDDVPTTRWIRDVPHQRAVRYASVYPGIDATYQPRDGGIELIFDLRPHAAVGAIELGFDAMRTPKIGRDGTLEIATERGRLALSPPVAWQTVAGRRSAVDVAYETRPGGRIGFTLGDHDPAFAVRIDPVVAYASAFGGESFESGGDAGLDAAQQIYVTGVSLSPDFPVTEGAFQSETAGAFASTAYVMKLDRHAESVLSATFISGSAPVSLSAAEVLPSGRVVFSGSTLATDYPVTDGAPITTRPVEFAGVLTCVAPSGSELVYSTYLSGTAAGQALDASPSGEVVVAVASSEESAWSTQAQFFGPNGSSSRASLMLIDSPQADVYVHDIAWDGVGNLFAAGRTHWPDLPTTEGAFQRNFGGGNSDAWAARFDADGRMVYRTLLGGDRDDWIWRVVADDDGALYALGRSKSSDFPTANAIGLLDEGGWDVTLTKFAPMGNALTFSTYMAGREDDLGESIALDDASNVLIAGTTKSVDYPLLLPFASTHGSVLAASPTPSSDGFVSSLTPGGILRWSSFLGGSPLSIGAVAPMGPCGDVLIVGQVSSLGEFGTRLPFQDEAGGQTDAYLTILQEPEAAFDLEQLTLPSATETAQITRELSTTCGVRPFAWTLTTPVNTLFVNGTFDADSGVISGRAREAGEYAFGVDVSDGFGRATRRTVSITVNPLPELAGLNAPGVPIGRPYELQLDVEGGTPPFAWRVDEGALPAGITLDSASARVSGRATGGPSEPVVVGGIDASGIETKRTYLLPAAPFLALDGSVKRVEIAARPNNAGRPLVHFVELVRGTSLRVSAKGASRGALPARLELLDDDGNIMAVAEPGKRRVAKLKNVAIADTGRYFLRLDPSDGFFGSAQLSARAKQKKTWKLGATLPAAGSSDVAFSSLPGARATIVVAPAKKSKALPTIASLRMADGTELLVAADLKEKGNKATLKVAQPLTGGDLKITIVDRGSVGGAVVVKVKLKGVVAYVFTLPDVVSGNTTTDE